MARTHAASESGGAALARPNEASPAGRCAGASRALGSPSPRPSARRQGEALPGGRRVGQLRGRAGLGAAPPPPLGPRCAARRPSPQPRLPEQGRPAPQGWRQSCSPLPPGDRPFRASRSKATLEPLKKGAPHVGLAEASPGLKLKEPPRRLPTRRARAPRAGLGDGEQAEGAGAAR